MCFCLISPLCLGTLARRWATRCGKGLLLAGVFKSLFLGAGDRPGLCRKQKQKDKIDLKFGYNYYLYFTIIIIHIIYLPHMGVAVVVVALVVVVVVVVVVVLVLGGISGVTGTWPKCGRSCQICVYI